MNPLPIQASFHSIIGVVHQGDKQLPDTDDTVVPFWSSYREDALSTKLVPYSHTAMFVQPAATDEIIRILKVH